MAYIAKWKMPDGTSYDIKAVVDGEGNVITNKYVTLDTTQTISGAKTITNNRLQVNHIIFSYAYGGLGNNYPAFVWDKPGSYYTGVGANGTTNRIYFGPVNSDGSWAWVDNKSLQSWEFGGQVIADNGFVGSLSGNASSATNADTLDGYHASSFSQTSHSHNYLPLSGGTMTGIINMQTVNTVAMDFRPDNGSYYTTIAYETAGNEALVFGTKNNVTSFIFYNGEDTRSNISATRWYSLVGGIQMKKNCLSIQSGWANDVNPDYVFKCGGTGYFNNELFANGGIKISSYGKGAGLYTHAQLGTSYSSTNNAYTITLPSGTETGGALCLCSTSSTSDFGMVYISCDTAFVANSGDTGYVFKVIDKDMAAASDYNSNDQTCMGVKQGGAGTEFKGNVTAGAVYSAVWNDYAEYRRSDEAQPGRVVLEDSNGILQRATARLQAFAGVVSDTFGFAEGETEDAKTPLAVAGRVLVYPFQEREKYQIGDCVCAAPNGTVDVMTRQEIKDWPDRIVGTVSEIPTYERWGSGDVEVADRIWIKVK